MIFVKQKPQKPTGNIPSIKVSFNPSVSSEVQKSTINFSSDKEKIEKQALVSFVKMTAKAGFTFLGNPKQNKQDDFDFSLILPGGKIYLELTEFVINDKEIPYQTFNISRTCGDLYDMFMKTINNKVMKAKKRLKKMKLQNKELLPVDLLCYTTHSDYNIDDVVVVLLQHTLLNHQNPFENIFLLQPVAVDHAHIRVLKPYSGKIIDKNTLDKLRSNRLINLL